MLGVVPLLCAECSEEESQVGLVVPEDVRPSEAETVILPRTPDEALVVDVARGPDSGSMIEQTHRILMQVSYVSATTGRRAMCRALYGCVCLRYLASALTFWTWRPVGAPALVCVCVRETSRTVRGGR